MDHVGSQAELCGNARGRRRDGHAKQRMVGNQTQMQHGWNHSYQICQLVYESLGAGNTLVHWFGLVSQFYGKLHPRLLQGTRRRLLSKLHGADDL